MTLEVTDIEISPENPEVGETITIKCRIQKDSAYTGTATVRLIQGSHTVRGSFDYDENSGYYTYSLSLSKGTYSFRIYAGDGGEIIDSMVTITVSKATPLLVFTPSRAYALLTSIGSQEDTVFTISLTDKSGVGLTGRTIRVYSTTTVATDLTKDNTTLIDTLTTDSNGACTITFSPHAGITRILAAYDGTIDGEEDEDYNEASAFTEMVYDVQLSVCSQVRDGRALLDFIESSGNYLPLGMYTVTADYIPVNENHRYMEANLVKGINKKISTRLELELDECTNISEDNGIYSTVHDMPFALCVKLSDMYGNPISDAGVVSKINNTMSVNTTTGSDGLFSRSWINSVCGYTLPFTFKYGSNDKYAGCALNVNVYVGRAESNLTCSDVTGYSETYCYLEAKLTATKTVFPSGELDDKILDLENGTVETIALSNRLIQFYAGSKLLQTSNDEGETVDVEGYTGKDGTVKCAYKRSSTGTTVLTAKYNGGDDYLESSTSFNLTTLDQLQPTIEYTGNANGVYNTLLTLKAYVYYMDEDNNKTALTGRTVRFKVGSTTIGESKTDNSGVATISYTPTKTGTISIVLISYRNDNYDMYRKCTTTESITISKAQTQLSFNKSIYSGTYDTNVPIKITLKDNQNNTLPDKTITLKAIRDDTTLLSKTSKTDSNGVATINIKPDAGTYILQATYAGNSDYASITNTATCTIKQLATKIVATDSQSIECYPYNNFSTKIQLLDNNNESLSNMNVAYTKADGTETTLTTDSNGYIEYTDTLASVRTDSHTTQTVTYTYTDPSNNYASSTKEIEISILKIKTLLILNSTTAYIDENSTINGTLYWLKYEYGSSDTPTETKNYLQNKTVKIIIQGKTYTTTTDSNGKCSINYTFTQLGKYEITGKYTGDSTYASNQTVLTINTERNSIIDDCTSLSTFDTYVEKWYPNNGYGSSYQRTGTITDGHVTARYSARLMNKTITTTDNCTVEIDFKVTSTGTNKHGTQIGLHTSANADHAQVQIERSSSHLYVRQGSSVSLKYTDVNNKKFIYDLDTWHTLKFVIEEGTVACYLDDDKIVTCPTKLEAGLHPVLYTYHSGTTIQVKRMEMWEL